MATYREKKAGVLVRARLRGVNKTATFDTKEEAEIWAEALEKKIKSGGITADEIKTKERRRTTLQEFLVVIQTC
ncbi:hypothetical protein CI610_02226 [invertebrate metagenome]|uniref:Uncharacterized protein n=1 Tax=invertebrate metagenome TaxID=1711999 RepID=A0A2H9T6J3_9ZZZZ